VRKVIKVAATTVGSIVAGFIVLTSLAARTPKSHQAITGSVHKAAVKHAARQKHAERTIADVTMFTTTMLSPTTRPPHPL
jgi:hypothetical protein